MGNKSLDDFTANDVSLLLYDAVDAVIVAEGVETKEQVELMAANRCDQAQGFFFDRPMPKQEFELRLERRSYEDKVGRGTE